MKCKTVSLHKPKNENISADGYNTTAWSTIYFLLKHWHKPTIHQKKKTQHRLIVEIKTCQFNPQTLPRQNGDGGNSSSKAGWDKAGMGIAYASHGFLACSLRDILINPSGVSFGDSQCESFWGFLVNSRGESSFLQK